MSTYRLLILIISLICIAPLNVWSQNEDQEAVLNPASSDSSSKSLETPSPLNLQSNWWAYFNEGDEQISTKADTFLNSINELLAPLNEEQWSAANEFIVRIKASLNALIQLKETKPSFTFEATSLKEQYTLDELQKLENSLRELKSIYNNEFPAFKEEQKATNALAGKIDDLNAIYKNIESKSSKKLISGLELVANRLAWLVSTQNEPFQNENLKSQENLINTLSEEIEHARSNFTVTEDESKEIDKEIIEQTSNIKILKKSFIDAQSQSLEIIDGDLTSFLKSNLLKKKSLLAEINYTQAETHLNYLQAKHDISTLKSKNSDVSADELVKKYHDREAYLKTTRTQHKTWYSSLLQEINQLLESKVDIGDNSINEFRDEKDKIIKDRRDNARNIAASLRELDRGISDLNFFNDVLREQLAETQGVIFKLRSESSYTFNELWKNTWGLFNKSLFSIGDIPVTTSDIVRALVIVFIAYLISRIVRNILTRISGPNDKRSSPVFYTLSRLSHYLILIIGIIIALSSIGLNFTNLAIVAGALSVGIGFGLQSIVNNFVSGIIVLFEQNIKVGDYVQLDSGMTGVVKGIHVRSTVITTLDNLDIIVPNSELVTAKVVNYTMNEPMFRIHVPFGVAYGADKTIVEKAGLEAARKVEVTYDDGAKRRPQVWLVGFGDSSLDFELIVWVVNKLGNHATPGSWRALYIWEIESALQKYGIEIPFPQRDLHLRSGFTNTVTNPEF